MIPVKNTVALYTIGLTNRNANNWKITTNNLKRLSNLGNALIFNSGEYKLNYKNRKKLLNALIVLEKIKKKNYLKPVIKNQRNKLNETRKLMIRNFQNKRVSRVAFRKFKAYPSKIKRWNKTIRAPEKNEEYIELPDFKGRVAKTPWTMYLRNRL